MKRVKFRGLAAGAAGVLLMGALSACGSSPDDASKDDFCDAYNDLMSEAGGDFDKYKDKADELSDVGTPEDIDGKARDGFELMVDTISDSGDEDELEEKGKDFSDDEEDELEAFITDATKLCAGGDDITGGDTGDEGDDSGDSGDDSGEPGGTSEIPSDLPSDLPTELPSDLPTNPEDLESMLSELPTEMPS